MLTEHAAAEILLAIDAFKFSATQPFQDESDQVGPLDIDCRRLCSFPRERGLVADAVVNAFEKSGIQADVVVGAGTSSVSLAECVSRRLGLPMAYVRRAAKAYGKGNQIEGAVVTSQRVLLVADIISTGKDIPTSVEAIKAAGGTTTLCLAILDMQMDGNVGVLEANRIPFASLTNLHELLQAAETQKQISPAQHQVVRDWRASPSDWEARRVQQFEEAMGRIRRGVSEALVRTKAVQIRTDPPFQYASGGTGPIYTDNRILMGHPSEREVILNAMAEVVVHRIGLHNIDGIAAVATGGVPFGSGLAERLSLPMVIVNSIKASAPSPYQVTEKAIEGNLAPGMRMLLLEDLVNSGGSTISAANTIREAGAKVAACLCVMTYNLPDAGKRFKDSELTLLSLSDLNTLLAIGQENGTITEEQAKLVTSWQQSPRA